MGKVLKFPRRFPIRRFNRAELVKQFSTFLFKVKKHENTRTKHQH